MAARRPMAAPNARAARMSGAAFASVGAIAVLAGVLSVLVGVPAQAHDLVPLAGPGDVPGRLGEMAPLLSAGIAAIVAIGVAGLLAGRKFTAHFSTQAELPQALHAEKVVQDGNIVTSRGAGTAIEFGLALVGRLCGEAAAQDVAKAIMV